MDWLAMDWTIGQLEKSKMAIDKDGNEFDNWTIGELEQRKVSPNWGRSIRPAQAALTPPQAPKLHLQPKLKLPQEEKWANTLELWGRRNRIVVGRRRAGLELFP